ncbi:MAG TPA: nucleotidyltransferase family protein [Sphingomonadaceae bacterium]|nr:nucleotidyltransferase family protein [Sphingomonadaceae bacterium]
MAGSQSAEFEQLCRLLLGMLRPQADANDLASLTGSEWEVLARLAMEQRLAPLLHAEWRGGEGGYLLPEKIQGIFAEAHRQQALTALAQRSDLLLAVQLLADAGIGCVALKGAMLAWHAYPAAGQRPLRDLDLLIAEDDADRAWTVLHSAGFAAPLGKPGEGRGQTVKHLPPLVAPQGSEIELHLRCWEEKDAVHRPMPSAQDLRIMRNSRKYAADDPISYPSPDDLLMHLAIHATAPYPLDAGPLMLADIDFLVRRHPPDWESFWERAAAQGWSRHAAYAIALTDRWRKPGLLMASHCPQSVPEDLLDAAPALLFQPYAERAATQFRAMMERPSRAILEKARTLVRKGGLRWLGGRILRTIGDAANPEIRNRASSISAVSNWLNA